MTPAFDQMELDQNSRFVTTFQFEHSQKLFKRLILGFNAAAKVLQHVLQTILADIPGTTDTADNILIFAENTRQHQKTLTQVLKGVNPKASSLILGKTYLAKTT